jgi:hypothetical protein
MDTISWIVVELIVGVLLKARAKGLWASYLNRPIWRSPAQGLRWPTRSG